MSAAAVIAIRIKRIFRFLRDRQATSPETAIPESEIPYSDRWYYRRLVEYGAVKRIGSMCYLDEPLSQSYLRDRRRRGVRFLIVVVILTGLYYLLKMLS